MKVFIFSTLPIVRLSTAFNLHSFRGFPPVPRVVSQLSTAFVYKSFPFELSSSRKTSMDLSIQPPVLHSPFCRFSRKTDTNKLYEPKD